MAKLLLFENKSIFSSGGVIGRVDYLIALIKLCLWFFAGGLLFFTISYTLRNFHPAFNKIMFYYLVVGGLILLHFKYINSFKRIRDIRGLTINQMNWQIAYVLLSLIPGLGIIAFAILIITPGTVTPNLNKLV